MIPRNPRRTSAARRRQGTALLEVSIAMGLLAVFGVSTFMMAQGVVQTYRVETASSRQSSEGRDAIESVALRLRAADALKFDPVLQEAPFSDSAFEFMRVALDEDGNVLPGVAERLALEIQVGEPDNGFDDDGDGLIDERSLVWTRTTGIRTVLCTDVAETLAGEAAGNGLDDNGNGLIDEAGFCATLDGDDVIVRLTLLRALPGDGLRELGFERRIGLQNRGVLP